MKVEIKVPAVGEPVSEAIVAKIIKASGSQVQKDEEIIELETDKVNQVIYAPQSGLLTLSVAIEDKVQIGQVIGFVDTEKKESFRSPAPAAPASTVPDVPKPITKSLDTSTGARVSQEQYIASVGQKTAPKVIFEPPKSGSDLKPLKTKAE